MGVFVDDCYIVAPQTTITSAFGETRELCSLQGPEMDRSMEQPPAAIVDITGSNAPIETDLITASLTKQRTDDYVGLLGGIVRMKNPAQAAAAELRGKLGFAQSMICGKYGRAMLREFPARQYSAMPFNSYARPPTVGLGPLIYSNYGDQRTNGPLKGHSFPAPADLAGAIYWWVDALLITRPGRRSFNRSARSPFTLMPRLLGTFPQWSLTVPVDLFQCATAIALGGCSIPLRKPASLNSRSWPFYWPFAARLSSSRVGPSSFLAITMGQLALWC